MFKAKRPGTFETAEAVAVSETARGGRLAAPNIGGFVASNTDVVEEYDPASDSCAQHLVEGVVKARLEIVLELRR